MRAFLVLSIIWFLFSFSINLNHYFLPNFIPTIDAAFKEVVSGTFVINLAITMLRVISGLFIGLTVGIFIGLLLGLNMGIQRVIMPVIEFIRGIPTSMLFPVFIVSLGVGEISKTAIVATATFPIIIVSLVVGCSPRAENQDRRDFIFVHTNHLPSIIRYLVILWDAIPAVLGGIKVAISMALVLTIVTEMFFVASSGVGWAAYQAYQSFDLELMYAYILLVGAIGVAINAIFDYGVREFGKKIGLQK